MMTNGELMLTNRFANFPLKLIFVILEPFRYAIVDPKNWTVC